MARYRTFWQDFLLMCRYSVNKRKFCVCVCKSVCVHAHAQTKRSPKFGTEILERVFEKTSSKRFFKNRSRFFKMIFKNIFLEFFLDNFSWTNYFFYFTILLFFARYSRSTYPKFSIDVIKRNFKKTLMQFFSKIILD